MYRHGWLFFLALVPACREPLPPVTPIHPAPVAARATVGWFDPEADLCFDRLQGGPPKPPSLDDYVELDPGEEFSTLRQLGCTFALPDAGPWRIVAHFRDRSSGPPPQRDDRGRRWFNGALDSNVLELTVPTIEAVRDSLGP